MATTDNATENAEVLNTDDKKEVKSSDAANTKIQSGDITKENAEKSNLLSELPLQSSTLLFGLNFKYTKVKKRGLINRLKGNMQTLDIDISCVVFDDKLQLIDSVWFKQLRDSSNAIRHQGDSINGKDRGSLAELDRNVDVETIELRLARLPESVSHIALLLSSYYDYPLRQISRGNVYISDDEGNEVFAEDLTRLNHDSSAICVAVLSRELGEWRLTIKDLKLDSVKMSDMTRQVEHELARIYA